MDVCGCNTLCNSLYTVYALSVCDYSALCTVYVHMENIAILVIQDHVKNVTNLVKNHFWSCKLFTFFICVYLFVAHISKGWILFAVHTIRVDTERHPTVAREHTLHTYIAGQ